MRPPRLPPGTENFLETFLRLHPEHPRAFAAALALAEYSLPKASTAPDVMRGRVERASQLAKAPGEKEQVTRLSLHFDSLTATPDVFAKKVEEYLAGHPPGSKHRAEVLFKLAERLHNAGQSAAAKARFLQLVKEEPDAEEVEMALFYAGKAALGSQAEGREEEAMKLWDQVARGKGPLRFYARLEQGKLDQRRSPKAAPQIFDSIINAVPPPEASLLYQALCLRGETQLALSLDTPALLTDAMSSFDQVLNSPNASIIAKQQAQVRKGDGFLRLKQERAALEAYYDAMNLTQMGTTAASKDVDYFWFFRAGEKAMRLLEGKQDWKAAVAIAQKLADAPGPRGGHCTGAC